MLQDWTIYSWYCPNCKTEVCGLKNKKDQIKSKQNVRGAVCKWFVSLSEGDTYR